MLPLDNPPSAKRLVDLLETDFPDQASYIEPEVLPKGGTLIFGGEAKIGKSWMMSEFARALVLKRSPFDYRDFFVPERARVLIVEQELGPRGFKKRMQKVFDQEDKELLRDLIWYESKRPELQFDRPEGRSYFADMVADVKPNVLILDPISMMHGMDENDSSQIGKLFRYLEQLKRINPEQEMSVILSHHFGKPQRDQTGGVAASFDRLSPYNFRGSSKWKDTPDTICTIYRSKELPTPWEAWEIKVRWITRHESSPPDMVMTVNEKNNDGRVRWVRDHSASLRPLVEGPSKEYEKQNAAVVDSGTKLNFKPI